MSRPSRKSSHLYYNQYSRKKRSCVNSDSFWMVLIAALFIGILGLIISNQIARNNDPNYRPDLLESIFVEYHPYDYYNETSAYISTTDGDFELGHGIPSVGGLVPGTMYCFTLSDSNTHIYYFFEGTCPLYDTTTTTP